MKNVSKKRAEDILEKSTLAPKDADEICKEIQKSTI